jgi:7-carboxy-7-deazaguanine synthase
MNTTTGKAPKQIRLNTAQIPETLMVHEIYASIQGESSFAGIPCTFIRLTGCNLRCSYCDTEHAFYEGTRMLRSEVLAKSLSFETPLVELTGGEPLLQPGSISLMRELADANKTVLVETSGERDISMIDSRVHRIVDLKAHSGNECARNYWPNIDVLTKKDEVKFVLGSREDYEWARGVIREHQLHKRVAHVLLSCIFGALDAKDVVSWMLADRLPVRFQLQMHKFIWPAEAKGV